MYDGVPSTDPARDRSESAEPLRAVAMTVSPLGSLPACCVVDDPAARQDLRQAPVHHLDLAERAHHHVRRLQVAVDHAPGVGVSDGLGDRLEDRQEPGQAVARIAARPASSWASVSPLTSFMLKNGRRSAKVPSS